MKKQRLCPCHSGKPYQMCCAPYHKGEPAPTPLALMRSRYSAYALGKIDYILKTQEDQSNRSDLIRFANTTLFVDLEILDHSDQTVTFVAHLKQNGELMQYQEKSLFDLRDNHWIYTGKSC